MAQNKIDNVKIVGVYLVKNEEVFLEQVITNTYDFCDKIIIADNYSEDSTYDIALDLSKDSEKIHVHRVSSPGDAHALVRPFCNTKTWVFAVDGDEIYDPKGLAAFKKQLINGRYDDWWVIFGNVLNCTQIDLDNSQASGYLAPPCRSMTKLYNFNAITDWTDCVAERMLGGTIYFKDKWDASLRLNIHENVNWDQAIYRCLHTCFMCRSKQDKLGPQGMAIRENPAELRISGIKMMIKRFAAKYFNRAVGSDWKLEKYMRGELVHKDVAEFFSLRFQDLHHFK